MVDAEIRLLREPLQCQVECAGLTALMFQSIKAAAKNANAASLDRGYSQILQCSTNLFKTKKTNDPKIELCLEGSWTTVCMVLL